MNTETAPVEALPIGWRLERNFGLDVIRGGGITLFVLYHALQLFAPFFPKIWIIGTPAVMLIEFFFIMSGFLIGSIFLRNYLTVDRFQFRYVKRFIGRRWLRTLPLYFIILLVIFILATFLHQPFIQRPDAPWKYFFFLQAWDGSGYLFFPESWSLCVEEWFYLALPLVLWVMTLILERWIARKWIVVVFIVTTIITVFLYRTLSIWQVSVSFEQELRHATCYRLDAPVYGVAVAWFWYYFQSICIRWKNKLALLGVGCLVIALLLVKVNGWEQWRNVLYWPVMSIGFSLLIPFFVKLRDPGGWISKGFRYMSRACYSLYLLHLSIGMFGFVMPLIPVHSLRSATLALVVYLAFALVFSAISYYFIERPILRWRDRRFPEL